MLDYVKELIEASNKLNIEICLLNENEAQGYIRAVLAFYNPFKTDGHLGIGKNTVSIPTEKYEFTYSQYLKEEPAYVFWGQDSNIARKSVVKVNNAKRLGELFENSYGMEYFVSNETMDYLIAVNWYTIEIAGLATQYLLPLNI
ncbi:hypothetical protein [Lacrimispora indolis]|uniref:hypothetical protein n=1 Tax=Lacrimispora indolis TaxID=69825 RepID=UPI00045E94B9|nr:MULTISPECIES: hypothetical protein [Lachnospiraceae]